MTKDIFSQDDIPAKSTTPQMMPFPPYEAVFITPEELTRGIEKAFQKFDDYITEKLLPAETDTELGMKSCDPQIYVSPQDAIALCNNGIISKEEARKILGFKEDSNDNAN